MCCELLACSHLGSGSLIKLPVTGEVHLGKKVRQIAVRDDAYREAAIR